MKTSTAPYIGDLLITFKEPSPIQPARFSAAPWQVIERGENWQLWGSDPSSDWKGFPLCTVEAAGWKIFSLGEFTFPADVPLDPDQLPRLLATFNGRFLVFAWEEHEQRWHIWTDRFATLHAYRSGRAVGTFSPAVAAFSQKQLDWQALSGFFGFGFFPQDRTHIEGVTILRPAAHVVLNAEGELLSQERYWQWHHHPERGRSYSETVDEFGHIFEAVMTGALQGGQVAVPLSGGLDSRSTVAPIHPAAAPVSRCWAYSYGYSDDSVETRIARQVAAARDLPFQAYTIQPYLFADIQRIMAWTEGFQDITQARQAFVRDEIASHADSLIGALWGDVWLDDMGLAGQAGEALSAEAVTAHALCKIQKGGRRWLFEHLVRPNAAGFDPDEALINWVRPELDSLLHIAEPDFRVKAFKMEQWSFRWSLAPVRVFQSAAWPRLVFYDTRLADFFCTVPGEFLPGRRLQIDYLKRFAPDLARIKWQVYDANLYHYTGFNTWLLPKRAFKKAVRVILGRQVLERNWEVQFAGREGRQGLENHLIRPGLRLHDLVPAAEVKDLLDSFYARSDPSLANTVSMLLTFSAWLELYG